MTCISSWSFIYEHRKWHWLNPFPFQISDCNLLLSDVRLTRIMKQLESQDIPQRDKKVLCYFFVLKWIWFIRHGISCPLALWLSQKEEGQFWVWGGGRAVVLPAVPLGSHRSMQSDHLSTPLHWAVPREGNLWGLAAGMARRACPGKMRMEESWLCPVWYLSNSGCDHLYSLVCLNLSCSNPSGCLASSCRYNQITWFQRR